MGFVGGTKKKTVSTQMSLLAESKKNGFQLVLVLLVKSKKKTGSTRMGFETL
jgi:hypothetical protein